MLLGEDGSPYLYAKTPDSPSKPVAVDTALMTIPDSESFQVDPRRYNVDEFRVYSVLGNEKVTKGV